MILFMKMDDFWEFVNYVEDDLRYLPIPRQILRDMENPLERYTNVELLQRYRFGRNTIQTILLPLVYPNGDPRQQSGLPVPVLVKLCCALRYFASGSYQRVCGDLYRISQPSSCRIVKEVANNLVRRLNHFVKFPQRQELVETKRNFFLIAGFPGVIGCIDGTHIEIKNPGGERGEIFRNRKSWFSINVQAVAGPNNEIYDIVIRWPGSAHDSRIFNNSSLKLKLDNRQLRGLLLGDSAYPQSHYLYTPVPAPQTVGEIRYNSAHVRTRNTVERTFGIWKQRFRCIRVMLNHSLPTTTSIIGATAVLHNIAIAQKEQFVVDPNFIPQEVPVAVVGQGRANTIRAAFIQRHFLN